MHKVTARPPTITNSRNPKMHCAQSGMLFYAGMLALPTESESRASAAQVAV